GGGSKPAYARPERASRSLSQMLGSLGFVANFVGKFWPKLGEFDKVQDKVSDKAQISTLWDRLLINCGPLPLVCGSSSAQRPRSLPADRVTQRVSRRSDDRWKPRTPPAFCCWFLRS